MSSRMSVPLPLLFLIAMTPVLIPLSVTQDSPQIGVGPIAWGERVASFALTLVPIPPLIIQDSPQDYVAVHNAARSQVDVGPIAWDERVAGYARNYANKLSRDCTRLVHSGGPYGENLAWASPDLTGTRAVNMWVGEKPWGCFGLVRFMLNPPSLLVLPNLNSAVRPSYLPQRRDLFFW